MLEPERRDGLEPERERNQKVTVEEMGEGGGGAKPPAIPPPFVTPEFEDSGGGGRGSRRSPGEDPS